MPLSLRIPPDKEKLINHLAKKSGKTKTAFIIEAVDEKLGFKNNQQQRIKNLAGWMSAADAQELRNSVCAFDCINEGDWE
ncbi:MAG: DUF1778 domain-containing protein [Deltaproteobacteria bacterium]|nr:DUF1778 domain-containing protein [Deltaproteobacteria bacterium]